MKFAYHVHRRTSHYFKQSFLWIYKTLGNFGIMKVHNSMIYHTVKVFFAYFMTKIYCGFNFLTAQHCITAVIYRMLEPLNQWLHLRLPCNECFVWWREYVQNIFLFINGWHIYLYPHSCVFLDVSFFILNIRSGL